MGIVTANRSLDEGLVLDLRMSEGTGTKVFDRSQYQNHGDFGAGVAAPTWVDSRRGDFGKALRFASGDEVEISDASSLDFTGAFTIAVWANPDATDEVRRLVYRYDAVSNDGYYLGQHNTDDGVWEIAVIVNPTSVTIRSDSAPTGNYQLIVGVREADDTVKLYVDEVLQSSTDTLAGAIDSDGSLWLGQDSVGGNAYVGDMDEVKMWNRGLSPREVRQLYRQRGKI